MLQSTLIHLVGSNRSLRDDHSLPIHDLPVPHTRRAPRSDLLPPAIKPRPAQTRRNEPEAEHRDVRGCRHAEL
jgi:hypothetical protein